MTFRRLRLNGWQQFEAIDIEFHPRLTVLTGANGSGKTTLLRFLARQFGWSFVQLRTPRQDQKKGILYYVSRLFGSATDEIAGGFKEVGSIGYASGRNSPIRIPVSQSEIAYEPVIDNPEAVDGVFLPSHRPEFRYQRVEQLPLRRMEWANEAYGRVQESMRSRAQGSGGPSSNFHMKEILIGLAIFGYGNETIEADESARALYEQFQDALRISLPPELGFQRLVIRDRAELVLVTDAGEFVIDAVSGGVGAIIELVWHIFMRRPSGVNQYTVVIDEPENHLHASMQRRLLPTFIQAFPNAQFIIATHSPLIVGSERESNVFVLRFRNESNSFGKLDRSVTSEKLDLEDKAGTAEDILREVLDVGVTMPVWAERAFEVIIAKHLTESLNRRTAAALRSDLVDAGLSRWVPEAIVRIADGQSPE